MQVRLFANFTVDDRFKGSSDHMINFASCLKSPVTLSHAWLEAVKRRQAPLTWAEVKASYYPALLSIKSDAKVLMVQDEHLLDWPSKLFGDRPLHTGEPQERYWAQLRDSLPDVKDEIAEDMPPQVLDFFHETVPRLLPNQRAVAQMAAMLGFVKNRWLYLALNTGLGKSTLMCELGYNMALASLSAPGRGSAKVMLLVVSPELVALYSKKLAPKIAEADQRVHFDWMDHATFRA